VWRRVWNGDRETKIPFQAARPSAKARSNDPATWSDFETALAVWKRGDADGVGFVFSEDDPYTGIDLDGCFADGEMAPWAARLLERFAGAYQEWSPSGTGVHVIAVASLPGRGGKRSIGDGGHCGVEAYDRGRYFTITGRALSPVEEIASLQGEIDKLYAWIKAPRGDSSSAPTNGALNGKHNGEATPAQSSSRSRRRGIIVRDLSSLEDRPLEARAIAYLDKMDPAISGQGGHDALMRAACAVVRFGIDQPGDVFRILRDYFNARCQPPWSDAELWHKAEEACRIETRRDLRDAEASDRPEPDEPEVNEAVDDPHRLARLYLAGIAYQGGRTLVFHQGEFYRWDADAVCHRPAPTHELSSAIAELAKREFDARNREDVERWKENPLDKKGQPIPKPQARKVGTRLIGDVLQALRGMTLLPGSVAAPAWLDGQPPFPAADVLPTRTRLVHLPSLVDGKAGATCPPTPRYFSLSALDFGYDAEAPAPVEWLKFLETVWPDDQEAIDTLQEWCGYLLTSDTSQQKIGVFIGPTRSGRGTIGRVIRSLVGADNVAGPTFAGLASHFGAACLIGKPAAIIADARLSGRSDLAVALERLLMISGEDTITLDRKNRPDWTGMLPTRIMLISNELPRLMDNSGALVGRFLLFRFERSFLGQEDRHLDAKLRAELPGILLWAIEGWRRLRARGHFVQPQSGQELLSQMRELTSPVGAFLAERCEIGPGHTVPVASLFDAWRAWCESVGREPGQQATLGRDLRTVLPNLKTVQPRDGEKRIRCFEGIGLRHEVPEWCRNGLSCFLSTYLADRRTQFSVVKRAVEAAGYDTGEDDQRLFEAAKLLPGLERLKDQTIRGPVTYWRVERPIDVPDLPESMLADVRRHRARGERAAPEY
jgi:putative DNA primase/helicase